MERRGRRANEGEDEWLDQRLRVPFPEFGEDGANVLVTGAVPREAALAFSRQFFRGSPGDRRLFVCTQSRCPTIDEWLGVGPADPAPGTVEIVRYILPWRSVATQTDPGPLVTRVTSERLSDLGRTVSDRIFEFSRADQGHSTGRIRVCVDSLTALLAEHDTESVFRFVHMMTGQTMNVNGLGQFHVTEPRDSETVTLLEPLFDAVAEIRLRGRSCQVRWHRQDSDLSSSWIDLPQ